MPSDEGEELKSNVDAPLVPPREDLVKTAAQFLQSPKVYKSPVDMKTAFLKKKGLSDVEIELAIKRSEEMVQSKVSHLIHPNTTIEIPHGYNNIQSIYWYQHSRWMKLRDIANTIALLGGLLYATFWLYKKYIEPYLFGLGKRSLETRILDLEKNINTSVSDIIKGVSEIKLEIDRNNERKSEINKQIEDLKSEITSLKKLMLNRKQFPSVISIPGGPLSIPAWQKEAAAATAAASSSPSMAEDEERTISRVVGRKEEPSLQTYDEGNGSGTNVRDFEDVRSTLQ